MPERRITDADLDRHDVSAPGWYADYLLALVVREVQRQGRGLYVAKPPDPRDFPDPTYTVDTSHGKFGGGPTLADALTALLDDLGADYEPMPSGDEVREARLGLLNAAGFDLNRLRDLYRTRPVLALAVLAGGDA